MIRVPPPRALVALLLPLTLACAQERLPQQETGTAHLALTGTLPGVTHLSLAIYDGPVSDINSQTPTFQPVTCARYEGAGGNRIKLQYLKASANYTLFVQLYDDDACAHRVGIGWRGNVAVEGGTDLADNVPTYYIQPYLFGRFTGLAQVDPALQAVARQRSCSLPQDCKAVHNHATCDLQGKCVIDDLFPLNGYVRRGLASSLPLGDGGVAIVGGFSRAIDGKWSATSAFGEVFDPLAGYFRAATTANSLEFAPVGLAVAVTDSGQAVVLVGGSSSATLALDAGKSLTTPLGGIGCGTGTAVDCPVLNRIQRWDVFADTLREASFGTAPGILPIVARVRTKDGDRLLVAGGAKAPINKNVDQRQAGASLCDLTPKDAISCPASGTRTMLAARANAASTCLVAAADGTCTSLLILGGRKKGGALAEIYDATTDSFAAVDIQGDPSVILHGGTLHRLSGGNLLLLGASNQAIFMEDDVLPAAPVVPPAPLAQLQPPTLITVTPSPTGPTALKLTPVAMGSWAGGDGGKRLLPAAVSLQDGSVLLIGGLDERLQPLPDALLFDQNGQPVARIPLAAPRVGGTATVMGGHTAVAGCALLAGGFVPDTSAGNKEGLLAQNHVEVFCPGP